MQGSNKLQCMSDYLMHAIKKDKNRIRIKQCRIADALKWYKTWKKETETAVGNTT